MPIRFRKQAASSVLTPGANYVSLFVDSANGLTRLKTDTGTFVELTNSVAVSASAATSTVTAALNTVQRVNVSSNAVAVNLPAGHVAGNQVIVKLVSAATNSCTVTPNGSETIDGQSSLILNQNYACASLVSDGANWMRVS